MDGTAADGAGDVAPLLLSYIPGAAALLRLDERARFVAVNAAFSETVGDPHRLARRLDGADPEEAAARLCAAGYRQAVVEPAPGGVALVRLTRPLPGENAFLRQVIDRIPDAIYAKDRQGRFLFKNKADAAMMGAESADAVIGRTDFDFYPPEIARATAEDDRRVIESGEPVIGKIERLVDHEGREYAFSTTKAPLRDASGAVIGLVGVGRDVTELQRMETALRAMAEDRRRAAETAEQALEAKSRFLATMSHELRTPLNGVLGLSAVLERTGLDPHQQRLVDAIRESGEVLLKLVSEIVDLAQVERGAFEIAQAPFRPSDLLTRLQARHADRIAAAGLRLTVKAGRGLDALRIGDENRLLRILEHLIDNAVKFSKGRRLEVEAEIVAEDLRLAVRDDGVGMTAEQRAHAFDIFAQGDSSETRAAGGVGLGLSVVAGIARAMRGVVSIDTAPGLGAACVVRVPAPLASEAPPADDSRKRGARALRVLVADMDHGDRSMLTAMLTAFGCISAEAICGEAATQAAREADYDVAMIALNLPDLDGEEAAMRIARAAEAGGRPAPTMVAIADTDDHDALAALRVLGFRAALPRPPSVSGLALLLKDMLAN
jgi:PAS domain S-box-containing protein